jgi:hypothetical protein
MILFSREIFIPESHICKADTNLDHPVGSDEEIQGLEVAMDVFTAVEERHSLPVSN